MLSSPFSISLESSEYYKGEESINTTLFQYIHLQKNKLSEMELYKKIESITQMNRSSAFWSSRKKSASGALNTMKSPLEK